MTILVKHRFVSTKGDGGDTSFVRPSNWNDTHDVELTGPALLGKVTAGAGDAAEIALGAGLAFSGGALTNTVPAIPVGICLPFAGATAPAKWLLCYGQAISRTTYALLFAAIGTAYGAGNGSSTFNVPDCRGRVVAGKDNMGGTAANRLTHPVNGGVTGSTLGAVGGEQAHTLLYTELARHDHDGVTAGSGSHKHHIFADVVKADSSPTLAATDAPAKSNTAGPTYTIQGATGGEEATLGETDSGTAHSHTFTTDDTGGDVPHNNVQPTIVMNTIIYAGA